MLIRYTTEDTRSEEQARADDRVREEIEPTGGVWAQMNAEQRALIRARLRDKKQRAQAARARKQAEQKRSRNMSLNSRSGSRGLEADGPYGPTARAWPSYRRGYSSSSSSIRRSPRCSTFGWSPRSQYGHRKNT